MNKFFTVMKFEYRGFTKSKSFIITTIVLILVILVASFIPQIVNLFSNVLGGNSDSKAGYIITSEARDKNIHQIINGKTLNEYMPEFVWNELDEEKSAEKQINSGKYEMVFFYDGGDSYRLYANGSSLSSEAYLAVFDEIMTQVVRNMESSKYPADVQEAYNNITAKTVSGTIIPVGGNASKNYWYAYVLQFALYMVMMIYGQFIMTSVMTEKSSKAMELLITSAKPMDLMFGKVIGVGLVALSQVLLLIAALGIGIKLNVSAWKEFMPGVFEVLKSMDFSFGIIGYFVLFFLIGYFSYAFLFASFGSTVSKPEEASTINTMPIMILVVVFILSMVSLSNMDATVFKVLSYVPLFSPFIMFNRICLGMATTPQIWISIAIAVMGLMFIGWLAARIYRVGIMIYGQPMNLKSIIQVIGSK